MHHARTHVVSPHTQAPLRVCQVYPPNDSDSSQVGNDQINTPTSRQDALHTIVNGQAVMSWLLNTTANLSTLVVRVPIFVSELKQKRTCCTYRVTAGWGTDAGSAGLGKVSIVTEEQFSTCSGASLHSIVAWVRDSFAAHAAPVVTTCMC